MCEHLYCACMYTAHVYLDKSLVFACDSALHALYVTCCMTAWPPPPHSSLYHMSPLEKQLAQAVAMLVNMSCVSLRA